MAALFKSGGVVQKVADPLNLTHKVMGTDKKPSAPVVPARRASSVETESLNGEGNPRKRKTLMGAS